MRNMKKYLAVFLTGILCLTGCGKTVREQKEEEAPVSVIAILKARNSLHWHFVMEGLEQTAKKHEVDLNVIWPEREVDADTQVRMIRDAIRKKPDTIILAPDDSSHAGEYAEQILQAGIHLLYVDENAEGESSVPYVGSDNYHAGELAAESIREGLAEGCVAYIGGSQSQQVHFLRGSGFRDRIEALPELQLTAREEVPDCSISGGKEAMQKILREHPEVQGVFCASALLCMGAQEACQSAGRTDLVLVGMDTQSDVLTALKNGKIHAIISQSGYEMGCRAIELAVRQQQGETLPLQNFIDNGIISRENVDDYLDAFVMEGRE